ncbi:nucleotide-binding universal stress UspA family protein [Catenulispora sp. GP43]|uniref:universal stress protein n=1 Tax=Catenulispora sp. GP43 TaxID=3156263 RepID=UPI003518F00A
MESGVVVGYDQNPPGERALDEAAAEAARREVPLTVVHAQNTARHVAEDGAGRVRRRHPGLRVRARTVAGPAPAVLAEEASGADLLVLGHRGGLRSRSVALRTVARAACPALVVRGPEHRTRGTVLAAVNAGAEASELLGVAFAEAASRGARLKAVSAMESHWTRMFARDAGPAARAEEALERLLGPWPDRYPDVETDHELIEGSPATFLTGATTYADLIVVGVRKRAGRGARVGPIAETLLMHSDCPVVVVPHS